MEWDDAEVVQLELKYCERCGGLWLRRQGEPNVYCATCAVQASEVPGLSVRKRRRSARLISKIKIEDQRRELFLVCGEGGHA